MFNFWNPNTVGLNPIDNSANMNSQNVNLMGTPNGGSSLVPDLNLNVITDMNQQAFGTNPVAPTQDFWSMTNPDAWKVGSQALGAVGGLANTYLGFEQLGMAKDQLAFNEEAFWTNYNMQVEDRELAAQRRAIASGKQ